LSARVVCYYLLLHFFYCQEQAESLKSELDIARKENEKFAHITKPSGIKKDVLPYQTAVHEKMCL